ncbi:hypothetical protein D3C87_2006220 [compost metagenome]
MVSYNDRRDDCDDHAEEFEGEFVIARLVILHAKVGLPEGQYVSDPVEVPAKQVGIRQ